MTQTDGTLTSRMIGAAMLRVDVYEEVEADSTATGQAAIVVALAAVCMAVGASDGGLFYAAWLAVMELGSWLVWAGLTYVIGEKVFDGKATWGELLRTLGFAKAAGVLYLLAVVPVLGGIVTIVVAVWVSVASFIAIRQALDISNGKTVLTWLVGAAFYNLLQNFPIFPF
ncbi:MAG: YIP1 family protein [Longimicrobiales bacterium]